MALDADKKPLEVISSNPGHLLFSRIINKERARIVASRMMRDDMFSGWGWRTMSQEERVFNPLSYHRGSVWPHDNSIVAHGMALYELRDGALRILTSLYQAASHFRDYRLPELFCGVQRREYDEPVQYPVSCSPQAWASGAMFLILASVLGIHANAPRKELNIINPVLPDWLDHLRIRNLRIGRSRVGLDQPPRRSHLLQRGRRGRRQAAGKRGLQEVAVRSQPSAKICGFGSYEVRFLSPEPRPRFLQLRTARCL